MSESTLATFMYFMIALLPLRYPNENPFLTQPKKMYILVSSSTLHFFLHLGTHVFPGSDFSDMAKHLMPFFACAAVSSLLALLFPERGATAFIYTIFALLVAGHMLFKLGVFDVEDGNRDNKDEVQAEQRWYESFVTTCPRYKNKLVRSVAAFFEDQTPPSLVESA